VEERELALIGAHRKHATPGNNIITFITTCSANFKRFVA
jgi:hypothetical protein